jgi:hypothetical protein
MAPELGQVDGAAAELADDERGRGLAEPECAGE